MDGQVNNDGEPLEEPVEAQRVLVNENPFSSYIQFGVEFLQQYGWFLLLGVIICLYLKSKLAPTVEKYKRQAEDARAARDYNPSKAQEKLEAMEASRRKMQEKFDAEAARYAEKQKVKEEEKRNEKIKDWEGHLEGKGYRSKYKAKEDTEEKKPLPKSKPLRQSDYNPLMGDPGGSSSWRPPRRGGGGGGG